MFVGWGLFALSLYCVNRFGLAVLCIVSINVASVFAFEDTDRYLTSCTCSRYVSAACAACICFWFRGFRFGAVCLACNHSASPPGGNQVDGLPPA